MKRSILALAALAAIAIPLSAFAHKQWMVPSATVVAGKDVWVTVDGAVSNDLFFPDHVPMRLDSIVVTAPDGSQSKPQNGATGKYRSVFDVELTQQGTYRIANVNAGLSARWDTAESLAAAANGQKKEGEGPGNGPRGGFLRNATPEDIATKIPKDAKNVQISESIGRVETFVTNGTPSAIKPIGKGLELVPVTHQPNDLFAGEAAKFQLLVDGKPAPGLDVEIIRGGTRYRNAQDEIKAKSDAQGQFTVTWPEAGMYWLSTGTQDGKTSSPQAKQRRLGYVATLEVLPQ